ncbi:hypothetical protein YC2023_123559 [Brassica napus]
MTNIDHHSSAADDSVTVCGISLVNKDLQPRLPVILFPAAKIAYNARNRYYFALQQPQIQQPPEGDFSAAMNFGVEMELSEHWRMVEKRAFMVLWRNLNSALLQLDKVLSKS